MTTLEEQLEAWSGLHLADTVVRAMFSARLRAGVGLDLNEHEVLNQLAAAPEHRLRMIDLTQLLVISKAGTTRLVDRLEQRELVKREQPPDNRRVTYARLTPSGHRTFDRSREVLAAALADHFTSHLTDADINALRRITGKLVRAQDTVEQLGP